MALTLWTEHGPGHRSPAFFARIAKSLVRRDIACAYVVPTAAAKRRAEELCLKAGPEILMGACVLSHSQWFDSLAASNRTRLEDTQRLLGEILKTVPLDYFRQTDLLGRGISAALGAGILPDELEVLARDYGQEREQDLARAATAYLRALEERHLLDPQQLPGLALEALRDHRPLSFKRLIIDVGVFPLPLLWDILRALAAHRDSVDLHVIVPEMHRGRAEAALGVGATEISPDEWQATVPPPVQLYRAAHASAEYRWVVAQLQQQRVEGVAEINLMAADPDPTLFHEACREAGLLPDMALPLPLKASPVSAAWNDAAIWDSAPPSATLENWVRWWKARLYPPARLQRLQTVIATDAYACRFFRDVARWEEIWTRSAAIAPEPRPLSPPELRTLVDPLLHDIDPVDPRLLPYRSLSWETHLGEALGNLWILDASQEIFPRIAPSPFFRSAFLIPQDPNAQRIRSAFPSADTLLQAHMAAWQRMVAASEGVTAVYAAHRDGQGEQTPSIFFEVEPRDIIPAATEDCVARTPPRAPTHFLHSQDTLQDLRQRMTSHTFSITELEDFAECPFRHFARYILGIDVVEDDTAEIPARDEGQIIHRLLEHYYRGAPAEPESEAIRQHLQKILHKEIRVETPLKQIQIERLLTTATAAVVWDLGQQNRLGAAALQPTFMEWKFGYTDVPPLTLYPPDAAPVQIRGKVDRIDIHAGQKRLLLIDYKLRKMGPILGEIRHGSHLQIPLYLMAARALFPDHQILGGLLFDLKTLQRNYGIARKDEADFLGIKSSLKSLVKDETWEELLQTAEAHALAYVHQIRSGEVPIPPHDCSHCDWKNLLPWD